jgi:hypothetical protein
MWQFLTAFIMATEAPFLQGFLILVTGISLLVLPEYLSSVMRITLGHYIENAVFALGFFMVGYGFLAVIVHPLFSQFTLRREAKPPKSDG